MSKYIIDDVKFWLDVYTLGAITSSLSTCPMAPISSGIGTLYYFDQDMLTIYDVHSEQDTYHTGTPIPSEYIRAISLMFGSVSSPPYSLIIIIHHS